MRIYIHKISRRLRNLREAQDLTQEELAERLGISRQSIISVERGRCLPSLPLALKISEIFQKSLEDLFLDDKILKKGGVRSMPRHLMPWTPFGDVDRFFEDDDWPAMRFRGKLSLPPVNVSETTKDVIVTADIPGVNEEDINIEVGEDFVDIAGVRKEEAEEKEKDYYRKEVAYGSFQRRVPLPNVVDANKAAASIKEGQLKLVIPKLTLAKPKVTKIKIKKE